MRDHVRMVGRIHSAQAVIYAVLLAVFLVNVLPGYLAGRDEMPGLALMVIIVVTSILGSLAIASAACGRALMRRRAWALLPTIGLSILQMAGFPLGTAMGGYSLWVLLSPDRTRLLEEPAR